MSDPIVCPSDEELRALVTGQSASPTVEAHLETCVACGQRLEEQASAKRTALDWHPQAETALTPTPVLQPPEHPASFGDKYMVVGKLGTGGQGEVFRAIDRNLKRDVAIKWSPTTSDAAAKEGLLREGEKLARLTHPGIVRVYEMDVCDNRPYLVMEYAGRRTLRQLVEQGPMSIDAAIAIVVQLARALAYAHKAGVIHQDVKPENVLCHDDGRVQLADFGIARLRDFWTSDQAVAAGTPAFMAPEQLRNPADVSVSTDLYGLGGVLFFLLTGQPPRKVDANFYVAQDQIREGAIDWKPLDAKKLPRPLVDIVRKALATDPAQRYQNGEAMAADLERLQQKSKPVPWAWIAACVAGVALLVGAVAFLPRGNPVVPVNKPAAQSSITLRILRDTGELHVSTAKPDTWERALPIVSSDRISVSGRLAKDARVGVFAVTLGALCEVRELGTPSVTDGEFRVGKVFPLENSPATEIILVCAANEAPTRDAIAAILTPLPIWGTTTYRLPRNQLVAFDADKVTYAHQQGRVGDGQDDPTTLVGDAVEKVRAALRAKYDFVSGLAFTHLPTAAVGSGKRNDGAAGDQKLPEGGSPEEKVLFHEVMERLLQTREVRGNVPAEVAWPPVVRILPNTAKEFNAYALGMPAGQGKSQAVITEGYLRKVVKGNPDVLAAIMGHELVHLLKKHLPYKREVIGVAISRDQEMEADLEGAKIAVAAGYHSESGIRAAVAELQVLGNLPHVPTLKVTHPSWSDRLEMLDRKRSEIWKSMAAFDNGHYLLRFEQYQAAESCFAAVVKTFPESQEGWANLGYARLMQYCDALDEKDLRRFGIGQFAAGCFYSRPADLVKTRGINEQLWKDAVKALKKVCDNDPDGNFVLARANLGLAYLVHYDGTPHTKEALQHFAAAADIKGKKLDDISRAALLVNYAVAEKAAGNLAQARAKLLQARGERVDPDDPVRAQLFPALEYNLAMLDAGSDKKEDQMKALASLDYYLGRRSPASLWWQLAFEQYEKLGVTLKMPTKTRDGLTSPLAVERPRIVLGLEVKAATSISLGDPTSQALKTLGAEGKKGIPINRFSKLERYFDAVPGIDLLAGDKLLSIFVTSSKAPPIVIQSSGLGGAKKELRVGMPLHELNAMLKGQYREPQNRFIDDPQRSYLSYPDLGLAFRFDNRLNVEEIAIVLIPRK